MWPPTLVFLVILTTNPEPELLYVRPGEALPFVVENTQISIEGRLGTGMAMPLQNLRAPDEGVHLLALFSRDRLGNVSPPKWYLLLVDHQPPEIEFNLSKQPVQDEKGSRWIGPNTRITLKASDRQSGLKQATLKVNDQVLTSADDALELELITPGPINLSASASDQVGNQSAAISWQLQLDDQPPTGQLRIVGLQFDLDGKTIVGPNTQIEAEFRDTASGMAHWVPLLNRKEVDLKQWVGPWQAGTYHASAHAQDLVGNQVVLPILTFEVDTRPPVASWQVSSAVFENEQGNHFYKRPITLTAAATDEKFGPCPLEYFHTELGWLPFTEAITIESSTLAIRAQDRVGNTLNQTLNWSQDRDPPKIAIQDRGQKLFSQKEPITLVVGAELVPQVSDSGSGLASVSFKFDDGPFRPIPNWFQFRKRDQFLLTIKAVDQLGNQAQAQWQILVTRAGKRRLQ